MTKTNCDVCNGNLDMGQVTLYRDGVEIRTICFLVIKKKDLVHIKNQNKFQQILC